MGRRVNALRAETAALRDRCMAFEAVIEAITEAAFVKDLQGRYMVINTAGARLLGKSVEEVIGKDDKDLFDARHGPPNPQGRP